MLEAREDRVHWGEKQEGSVKDREAGGNILVVGFDPHPELLIQWGLSDNVTGARSMCSRLIEACVDTVKMIKPQSAFFERFGSRGIALLEDVIAEAKQAGLAVLLDAKRGDIGSTMRAYAEAYMDPQSPLAVEALTVSPYLGMESLQPAFALSQDTGTRLFILALTSNSGASRFQHARPGTSPAGTSVASEVIAAVERENQRLGHSQHGVVIGATIGDVLSDLHIDIAASDMPVLAPGFGAQGAELEDFHRVFGQAFTRGQVLIPMSRAIISAGPNVHDVSDVIRRYTRSIGRELSLR